MKERADKIEELLSRRDELMLSNLEWARLTRSLGGSERAVSYQTIRRMENEGTIPRHMTLRALELALDMEEARRGSRDQAGAAA